MSGMRKGAGASMLFLAAAMMETGTRVTSRKDPEPTFEERKAARQKLQEEVNRKRGLKEFVFHDPYNRKDETIWARDQKNANRKAKKKGYLRLK